MIQLHPHMKILVAIDFCDFRCGIDALAALCKKKLKKDPFSGSVFVFRNRSGTSIKLLCFDGTGFWIAQKRFSEGKLKWWPNNPLEPLSIIAAKELYVLLHKGDPSKAMFAEDWRKLPL